MMLVLYPVFLRVIARPRDPDEVFAVDDAALAQVAFLALVTALAGWRLLHDSSLRGVLRKGPIGCLAIYGLLGVLSALWSERPDYTVYRAFESLAFLVLVADSVNGRRALREAVKPQLLFGVIVALAWHFIDLAQRDTSLEALHNSVVPGALIGVIFLSGLLNNWRWRMAHGLVCVSVAVSTSTASYIAVLAGLVTFAFLSRKLWPVAVMALAGVTVGLLWLSGVDVLSWLTWNKRPEHIESVTGRLPVWWWVVEEKLPERPLLGFGFGVGESLARLYNDQGDGLRMTHMHNTLVSGVANLGLLGGCLVVLFWAKTANACWRAGRLARSGLPAAAFVACAVNSLAVPSIGGIVSYVWIAHVYLAATVTFMEVRRTQA